MRSLKFDTGPTTVLLKRRPEMSEMCFFHLLTFLHYPSFHWSSFDPKSTVGEYLKEEACLSCNFQL
jgi:hypothetical protein